MYSKKLHMVHSNDTTLCLFYCSHQHLVNMLLVMKMKQTVSLELFQRVARYLQWWVWSHRLWCYMYWEQHLAFKIYHMYTFSELRMCLKINLSVLLYSHQLHMKTILTPEAVPTLQLALSLLTYPYYLGYNGAVGYKHNKCMHSCTLWYSSYPTSFKTYL